MSSPQEPQDPRLARYIEQRKQRRQNLPPRLTVASDADGMTLSVPMLASIRRARIIAAVGARRNLRRRQYQYRPRIIQHERNTLWRIVGIHRQIRRAGLQDSQHTYNGIHRPRQRLGRQGRPRPRHRRLQRGAAARPAIRRRLLQSGHRLSPQGRGRPRDRRLRPGAPHQSEIRQRLQQSRHRLRGQAGLRPRHRRL